MSETTTNGVAVFGGAVFDRKFRLNAPLAAATSNPANGSHSHGGVARNVAENLLRLGTPVAFSSIVGDDEAGRSLLYRLRELGADVSGTGRSGERSTAEYAAVLDPDNELAFGIADMAIFELYDLATLERAWSPAVRQAAWIFADCNLPAPVLAALAERAAAAGIPLAVNTVSAAKAVKLRGLEPEVALLFTNTVEAEALTGQSFANASAAAQALLDAGFRSVVVTAGPTGYATAEDGGVTWHDAFPAHPSDITGAGDAFVAGTLHRLLAGEGLAQAARAGAWLAARTTETLESVQSDLSPGYFEGLDALSSIEGIPT